MKQDQVPAEVKSDKTQPVFFKRFCFTLAQHGKFPLL